MKTKIFVFLLSSLFLFGCMNTPGEKTKKDTETSLSETEVHHHDLLAETLVLDNGEKWKVDGNMMVYIQNMEADI